MTFTGVVPFVSITFNGNHSLGRTLLHQLYHMIPVRPMITILIPFRHKHGRVTQAQPTREGLDFGNKTGPGMAK